ncbi:MAG: segregation/condensation protein A [Clostridia bacterium]|nr:segregation/condensation protein A [Clostridia bacterium]
MPNVLTLETNKYAIKIENFEGPLDLLCHLIDKNKMDIYDIKISEITDQYISYINQMEKMNLEITSEFLVMASTLLYLKSKSLLPTEVEDEKELTEEELLQRIIEYKQYKEGSIKLKELYDINKNRCFRLQEKIELPKQKLEIEYKKETIVELYSKIINTNKSRINQNAKNIEKIAITDTYSVGSKVKEIFRELLKKPRFVFNKLYKVSANNKQEVVTAFTGLLELSRRSKVVTTQKEVFGDIIVEKAKRNNKV